ncbi:MAG: hypothetical protein GWN16_12630, partial [Calditrichae bacterium]|nr:hypothetical protein [Calditrichia bacterium]
PLEKNDFDHRKTSVSLAENDFFGNIYPLNEIFLSHAYTESTSHAELVRISRNKLIQICKRHTHIELGIIDLFKARSNKEEVEALRAVRKADRH